MPPDTPNTAAADVMTAATKARLFSFVQRVETVDREIAEKQAFRSEILHEAKGEGFNMPALRNLIARRGKDRAALQEQDAVNDLYLAAIRGD